MFKVNDVIIYGTQDVCQIVGVVGMVLVALAYPIYNRVLKKNREKIAPEILRLSDELLK